MSTVFRWVRGKLQLDTGPVPGLVQVDSGGFVSIFPSSSGGPLTDGDKGDITVSAVGTVWTIDPGVVTYAKIQDVSATDRFLGRKSPGAGDVEELNGTEATARLNVFTAVFKGLVPPSGGGTVNFLRADGTFAAPGGGGGASATEIEVNFGTKPVYDAQFTITDAAISPTSKVVVTPSGKVSTGRVSGDWQWDGATFAALPGSGSAICFATFHPGPIVGTRLLQYQVM